MSDWTQTDLYEASRHDFLIFLYLVQHNLNPSERLIIGNHIRAILWHLEQVRKGKIRRLLINIAPRSLKSVSVSVAFPLWVWTKDPAAKFLCASYGQELSEEFAHLARTLIETEWFQTTFPHVVLHPKKNEIGNYRTTRNGARRSTSTGGAVTGFGADCLIVDDIHKADDFDKPDSLQNDYKWFKGSFLTRLNDRETGAVIVAMQRLAPEDLSEQLIRTGLWTHLNLPAVATEHQRIQIGDNEFWEREPGDFLDPVRLGPKQLEEAKLEMGIDNFNAQYQQNPTSFSKSKLLPEWIKYHDLLK